MDEKDAETTQEQGDVKYLKIFYQVKNITQEPNIWNEEMKVQNQSNTFCYTDTLFFYLQRVLYFYLQCSKCFIASGKFAIYL